MINQFKYNNNEYKIIEGINVGGINFVICKDVNNTISYMKVSQLEVKSVFTPLDKLIKVLDEYKTDKICNIQKILNHFVGKMNKSLGKKRIKEGELSKLVIDFNDYCSNNFQAVEKKTIGKKELGMIDNFFSQKERKPLLFKLIYMEQFYLLLLLGYVY